MGTRGESTERWLLETMTAIQQTTTVASTRSEIGETITDTITQPERNEFAWIGRMHPSGWTEILSNSGTVPRQADLPTESVTAQADRSGNVQIQADTQSNAEYNHLREEYEIPTAASTVSIPFAGQEKAVLHLYTDADPSTEQARESFDVVGQLLTDAMGRLTYKTELERERERLEELRSVVSHDFGNPLNLAAGRLDLVRTECESEHIDHVTKGLDEINSLIDEVSTFVRVGREITDRKPLSLAELARDSWEYASENRGSVTIEDTIIRADPERLRRILNELIENCFVHTEGEITVEIGPLSDGQGFHLTDDGSGIPADELEYVFDRGYTKNRQRDGNGLAIVEEIADAHGWTVQIGESEGTRVEVLTDLW